MGPLVPVLYSGSEEETLPSTVRQLLPIVPCLVLAACHPAAQDDDDAAPAAFSFAILTDTHIGEGELDHGTPGYDDAGGGESEITARVRAAVAKINAEAEAREIRFAMHLGDLTDSGERSEYELARAIADELAVPYFPLIGNHDMWPYHRTEDGFVEAPTPSGDQVFDEVFGAHLAALAVDFPGLTVAPVPCDNLEHGIESSFVNFAFEVEGHRFVALDLVTRSHAPPDLPGIGPEADLHDFPGGTWPWLAEQLAAQHDAGDDTVLLFSHHPPLALGVDSLSTDEADQLAGFLDEHDLGGPVGAWFAGHWHLDLVSEMYDGFPVVVTGAAKEDSTVRVVRVDPDQGVEFETLL